MAHCYKSKIGGNEKGSVSKGISWKPLFGLLLVAEVRMLV